MTTDRTSPPDLGTPTRVVLVALLSVLTLEAVRASGPLLDRAYAISVVMVGVTALGVYAAAGLVVAAVLFATRRWAPGTPSGRTLLVGTVALGVARLAVQALDGGARFGVGMATAALAVGVLTLAVAFVAGRANGGREAAVGLVLGTGFSAGLQLVLGTWDAYWRHGPLGWVLTVALVAGTVAVARVVRHEAVEVRPRRLWSLGPYLALVVMVLANPAFVAAQSGTRLDVAGLVVVGASTVTVWMLLDPRRLTRETRVLAAVTVPVALVAVFFASSEGVLVAVTALEVAAPVVLATALSSRRAAARGGLRTSLVGAAVGLGLIVPLALYLVDYDVPLGIDNAFVLVAAGLALAAAGLRRRTPPLPGTDPVPDAPAPTPARANPLRANALRLLVIPAVILAVVGWWPSSPAGATPERARADQLVLVDWNLHYGVEPATAVDLETVARTIEAHDPDVVTLQEVSRGWVLGGGVDMATWLAHRLGMDLAYAPAADPQMGNAILSRSALTDEVVTALPYGAGPQHRSAVTATVTLADGTPVRVTSVHLQHRDENTPTRLEQLGVLLDAAPAGGAAAVIAGDLNAEPGWPELELMTDDGWTSAVDTAGDVEALTFPSDDPQVRIDWVLGAGVDFTQAEVVTGVGSSDHLPVVVTLVPTR
ncbi:endonuclease/exonuclease/phosphatase family protein [Cellulomonas sp. P22]|uniref:endonuclease/exonuclease/phosphatase family protein n=1 Tax=Cellulomonas sp. P22 TaxID=3373189 RepID=UPI0037AE836C